MMKKLCYVVLMLGVMSVGSMESVAEEGASGFSFNSGGRRDDFENVTQRFQIRNVRNGIALNIDRKGDFNTQNWFLRDFGLDPDFIRGKDPLAKSWGFGYVQFVDPRNQDRCLSIGEDGFCITSLARVIYNQKRLRVYFQSFPQAVGRCRYDLSC